jgi:hypothetical protein
MRWAIFRVLSIFSFKLERNFMQMKLFVLTLVALANYSAHAESNARLVGKNMKVCGVLIKNTRTFHGEDVGLEPGEFTITNYLLKDANVGQNARLGFDGIDVELWGLSARDQDIIEYPREYDLFQKFAPTVETLAPNSKVCFMANVYDYGGTHVYPFSVVKGSPR